MGKDEAPLLPPPLLLTSHGRQSQKQSFYNLLENRYHTTTIPELLNKSVLCSAYGWFVLLDRNNNNNDEETYSQGQCCLWNPTTLETIELPPLEGDPSIYNRCFLSKPPTDPDCFILFNQLHSMEQIVYKIQDNAVLFIESNLRLLSMVSFQGMIYGIIKPLGGKKYELVTIHMAGDKLETKPILFMDDKHSWEFPEQTRNWALYNMDYLIESPCGNELLLVTKMVCNLKFHKAKHFRVFRVDVGRMVCEELHNLDGQTVFISYDGNGFCRSPKSFGGAIKPNSIYYTNRFGTVMYVYDMDNKSTVRPLPCPGADINRHTAESFWVDLPADILMKNSFYFHVSS